jgi:cupin 2 domain-containing protein
MTTNLLADARAPATHETFTEILARPGVRIERIVSFGHASPPGFWYDQAQGEWVVVLAGEARLRFEDEPVARTLAAGDFVDIAPHRRHRVEWTRPGAPTVWLAVYYG